MEENAALPLAGGVLGHGHQCGMIWGASLAAGAEAYRRLGPGPQAEAATLRASRRMVESFRPRHDEINCKEITSLDDTSSTWRMINAFFLKGIAVRCIRMAGWYAPRAFDDIDSALSEEVVKETTNAPSPPLSCAASLARKMGESEMHAVMVSGFAGGVGLCGGACGALAAAIWILAMKIGREEREKLDLKDPRLQEVMDRFTQHTESRIECSEIVGRTFDDVDDHAEYLRGGGCRELMEVLAQDPCPRVKPPVA